MHNYVSVKKGFYLNIKTGEKFKVNEVKAGQNEVYGFCNVSKVISDYDTKDEFKYLGDCDE